MVKSMSYQVNENHSEKLNLTNKELRALQLKGLEILIYFRDFCEAHGLKFYLCGGSCIGALRHEGFIPWDDDVDVFMPRPDYEKLFELWDKYANTKKYSCNRTTKSIFIGSIMTGIADKETKVIRPWQVGKQGHKGVMIDVLPLDGCAPKGIKRKFQMFWSMIYSLYCCRMVPVNHGKFVALVSKLLLSLVPGDENKFRVWNFAQKQMTKYKFNDTQYITELCSGPHYMKNEYPREIFDGVVYKEFEGHLMPLPEGYDLYLKMAFGDYMKLPPEEDRTPHHDIIYMNLESNT